MRTQIPFVDTADLLIVEGTMVGCSMACQLARRGLRVVLAMSGTAPVEEIATCLRPWIRSDMLASIPAPLDGIFQDSLKRKTSDDEWMLHIGNLTEKLEDLLNDGLLPVGSLCSHLDYWPNHGWRCCTLMMRINRITFFACL